MLRPSTKCDIDKPRFQRRGFYSIPYRLSDSGWSLGGPTVLVFPGLRGRQSPWKNKMAGHSSDHLYSLPKFFSQNWRCFRTVRPGHKSYCKSNTVLRYGLYHTRYDSGDIYYFCWSTRYVFLVLRLKIFLLETDSDRLWAPACPPHTLSNIPPGTAKQGCPKIS